MRLGVIAVCGILAVACTTEPVSVELMDSGNGLARFTVVNRSDQDVASIIFEVSFSSQNGEVLGVDTVAYTSTTDAAGNPKPFVVAGEDTFFPVSLPASSVSASATILGVAFSGH